MQEANIMYVHTFGSFSVTWNGKIVTMDSRSGETQFIYLLQLLLHRRGEGVSRAEIAEQLFYDREVKDVTHSVNVLIYNTRKKLQALGLPCENPVENRRGRFFLSDTIPVEEDAAVFETLLERAESAEEPREKLRAYLEAGEVYTGEFLPAQAGILWVSQEARRYGQLFRDCVEGAAALLRARQSYTELERLGRHAALVQPFAGWESLTMEAMLSLGRPEEAEKLFTETDLRYFQEMRLTPDEKMLVLRERIALSRRPSLEMLRSIQSHLTEGEGRAPGAYTCPYSVFESIYRMAERMTERGGQSVYLMLCALTDAAGEPLDGPVMTEELAGRMEELLRCCLRQTDVVCRYSRSQFLLLLINTTLEDCALIQQRIDARFAQNGERAELRYFTKPLLQ